MTKKEKIAISKEFSPELADILEQLEREMEVVFRKRCNLNRNSYKVLADIAKKSLTDDWIPMIMNRLQKHLDERIEKLNK